MWIEFIEDVVSQPGKRVPAKTLFTKGQVVEASVATAHKYIERDQAKEVATPEGDMTVVLKSGQTATIVSMPVGAALKRVNRDKALKLQK